MKYLGYLGSWSCVSEQPSTAKEMHGEFPGKIGNSWSVFDPLVNWERGRVSVTPNSAITINFPTFYLVFKNVSLILQCIPARYYIRCVQNHWDI